MLAFPAHNESQGALRKGFAPYLAALRYGACSQRRQGDAARDSGSDRTLAEVLVMDSGALVHTLKPPERDGLVAVTLDADDRRNRLITLTRHGRAKLAETDALWAKAQRSFEAGFGRSDSESLREALRFLITDDFGAAFEKVLSAPVREFREEFNDRSQKRHV
jgi:DNA-binding MarR family transcriptional regulator